MTTITYCEPSGDIIARRLIRHPLFFVPFLSLSSRLSSQMIHPSAVRFPMQTRSVGHISGSSGTGRHAARLLARSAKYEPTARQPTRRAALGGPRLAYHSIGGNIPLHELAQKAVTFGSVVALLLSAPVNLASAADPPAVLAGVARVVDGDTLEVAQEKIRLFGVDAPEKAQSCTDAGSKSYGCGEISKQALQRKLENQQVSCAVRNRDQYGRAVASCAVGGANGEDIGKWLVSNGYAVAYREFSQAYVPDEDAAAKAKKGIWQGSFQEPKEWRKEAKLGTEGGAPTQPVTPFATSAVAATKLADHRPGCDIKGNIGSTGDRIYHVPKGRYYERTRIDTSKGEKWFCSEEEAVKAGWRASKE